MYIACPHNGCWLHRGVLDINPQEKGQGGLYVSGSHLEATIELGLSFLRYFCLLLKIGK